MVRVVLLAVLLVGVGLSDFWGVCAQLSELKIKEKILKGYNATVPPQSAQNGPIQLSMEIQVKDFSLDFKIYVIAERGLQNAHWKMISIDSSKTSKTSPLHNKTFTVILIKFIVEKISTMSGMCLTMPAMVMAIVNLLVLWLPLNSHIRYVLLMVIMIAHYLFLQQLSWFAPAGGDDTPFVLIFFRNSLFITACMLILITISRKLAARQYPVPRWIDIVMNLIDSQPLVAVLFPSAADAFMKSHDLTEDGTSLIDEPASDPMAVTYNYHWRRVCLILERICFVTLSVVYAIMLFVLLPSSNDKLDNIVPPVTKFM